MAKKKAGTMSLDVRDFDFDDGPKKGGGKSKRGGRGGSGRSAALGRGGGGLGDDDDDWAPRKKGGGRRGGGLKKKGRGGGGGFGKKKGTVVVDTREMAFDDEPPSRKRGAKAGWAKDAGGGGKKSFDDDDDEFSPRKKKGGSKARRGGLAGSKRDTAARDDEELIGGFDDWDAKAKSRKRDSEPDLAPSRDDEAPARLEIREPNKDPRVFDFFLKQRSIIIGREIGCDIVLSDPKSSRQHVEISYLAGNFTLKDLGSGNGTKVNGKKINRLKLRDGDVFVIGSCEMTFLLDEDLLQEQTKRDLHRGRDAKLGDADEDDEDDDEEEVDVVLSPLAMALGAATALGILVFVGIFVAWLIFRPEPPKPSGGRVAELEEIPQEDPSILEAQKSTATKLLDRASEASRAGKFWEARRHAWVANLISPGMGDAKAIAASSEKSLTGGDSDACEVRISPKRLRKGRPMTVEVALNGPVQQVSGLFMGQRLDFEPDPRSQGVWLAELKLPRDVERQPSYSMNLMITDLLEEPIELVRELKVR